MTASFKKTFALTLLVSILLFCFYTFVGVFVRDLYSSSSENFPTWTHSSSNKYLNVWTSWDSGFYYDIAKNGYPTFTDTINVAYIDVPAQRWLKAFLGGGVVGSKKYVLPSSNDDKLVNNVLFLVNTDHKDKVPLYDAYKGIPYCAFKGDIDYERDVLIENAGLTNPTACGERACDRTYITYYSVTEDDVVYQEYFDASDPETPITTLGNERPTGIFDDIYEGLGCSQLGVSAITTESQTRFDKQFTALPFAPLYPYISRYLSLILGDIVLSGLVLSFIFNFVASLVFYKLLAKYFTERISMYGALFYILNPFNFYAFGYLPIALFNLLFLSTLSILSTKKTTFLVKVSLFMLSCLLSLTHWLSIVMLLPFYYFSKKENTLRIDNFIVVLMGLLTGLGIYIYILYQQTGDILALLHSRVPWYGGTETFIGSFANYFLTLDTYVLFELGGVAFLALTSILGFYLSKKDTKETSFSTSKFYSLLIAFLLLSILSGGFTGLFKFSSILVFFSILFSIMVQKSKFAYLLIPLFIISGGLLFVLWSLSSRFVV